LLKADDLATLHIKRLIFHDVPRRLRGVEQSTVLSEIDATLDAGRIAHLKRRLVRALGSKSAYDIQFRAESQSPVPPLIRSYTKGKHRFDEFVPLSQKFAQFLFEQQGGSTSPGVLTVMDSVVSGKRALLVLKLEREEGAQLALSEKQGKQTFEMSVLDNLVLTDGTRLFKSALFVRKSQDEDDFAALACDTQRPFGSSDELAQFWLRFLRNFVAKRFLHILLCKLYTVRSFPQLPSVRRTFPTMNNHIRTGESYPLSHALRTNHLAPR
jgi:hypothetical protein